MDISTIYIIVFTNLLRLYKDNIYIEIEPHNIFYDGVADIAVLHTHIDFSNHEDIPLNLQPFFLLK